MTTTSNSLSLPVWDVEDLARRVVNDDLVRLENPPVERLEAANDLVIWLLHVPDRLDDPVLARVCETILRSRKPELLRTTSIENIRSGMEQLADETRATLIEANEPSAPRDERIAAITKIRQVALACVSSAQNQKRVDANR